MNWEWLSIVSFFYQGQIKRLEDETAVKNAVKAASQFLRDIEYDNILIEIANEYNASVYFPILREPEGMTSLIKLARQESGGIPVSSSKTGGTIDKKVAEESDYILIHGNQCSRQDYYKLVRKIKNWNLDKPIVCNEDSHKINQLKVAFNSYTSWGYYNNMTKQEPPADWRITRGEDRFFAQRMALGLGIEVPAIPFEEQFYLQGFEPEKKYEGKRWPRVASLYPEKIDYVDFYLDGDLIYTVYDPPHTLYYQKTWKQEEIKFKPENEEFKAVIHLRNGGIIEKSINFKELKF